MAKRVFEIELKGLLQSIDNIDDAKIAISELETQISELANVAQNTQDPVLLDEISNSADSAAEAVAELKEQFTELGDETSTVERLFGELSNGDQTLDDLNSSLEELEENLGGLAVGSQEAAKVREEIIATEKQIEFLTLSAEAAALGFQGLGEEGNTIEGLNVAVTALQAKLATLDDPLEQAQVEQQIREIGFAIEDAEAQAAQGIFPPGSIGALTAELESLELQIRRVPAGSAEFNKLSKRIEDVTLAVDASSLSFTEQRQLVADVASSAVGSFGAAVGALEGFGIESEAAGEALQVLEGALAAVEAVRAVTETAQLARQAALTTGTAAQTAATTANTAAKSANAAATVATSVATTGATAATGGLTGAVGALSSVLLANPIFLIGAVILGVVVAVQQLSKRFEFFQDIVDQVGQAFAGVINIFENFDQVTGPLLDSLEGVGKTILNVLLIPLSTIGSILTKLGKNPGLPNLDDTIKNIKDGFNQTAEAVEETIDVVDRLGQEGARTEKRLQEINRAIDNNQIRDLANERKEIELGSAAATEEARRDIRIKALKEDEALLLEKFKLENKLNDDEIQLLKEGNIEKLKENKKFFKNGRDLNTDLLEQFGEVQEKQTAILQEQEERRLAIISQRVGAIERQLELENIRLDQIENFAAREEQLRVNLNAELEKLELQRQAGEFATVKEFQDQRLILQEQFNSDLAAVEAERETFLRELEAARRERVIENLEFELEERKRIGEATLEQELGAIQQVAQLRLQSLQEELDSLDAANEEELARIEEIEQEKLQIRREASNSARAAIVENAEAIAESARQELALRDAIIARQNDQVNFERELAAEQEQRLISQAEANRDARQSLIFRSKLTDELIAKNNEAAEAQVEAINTELEQQLKLNEAQLEGLDIEQQRIETLLEAGEISKQSADAQIAALNEQRNALQQNSQQAIISAENSANAIIENNQKINESLKFEDTLDAFNTLAKGFETNFTEVVGDGLNKLFQDTAFEGLGETFANQALEVFNAVNALTEQLTQNRLDALDEEIEQIEERSEGIQETLDLLSEEQNERIERTQELYGQLAEAEGNERAAIIAQIENEKAAENELTTDIIANEQKLAELEKKKAKAEKQRQDEERKAAIKQKAIDLAQAAINTALAVTAALATQPFIPLGPIAAGIAGTLGAIQIATIAATPIPAEDGGILDGEGLIKFGKGGVVKGKSHKEGGVRGTGRFNNIEVEGGEAVISKKATQRNMPIIQKLLEEGDKKTFKIMEKGGFLPYYKLQTGGTIPLPSTDVQEDLGSVNSANVTREVTAAVQDIQNPVVSVVDIVEGQNRTTVIDDVAQG